MQLATFQRNQLLEPALAYSGINAIHQSGPAKGKPFGARRLSRIISRFIEVQKQEGAMIELRPRVFCSTRSVPTRKAQFVLVPRTIDMFSELASEDRARANAQGALA